MGFVKNKSSSWNRADTCVYYAVLNSYCVLLLSGLSAKLISLTVSPQLMDMFSLDTVSPAASAAEPISSALSAALSSSILLCSGEDSRINKMIPFSWRRCLWPQHQLFLMAHSPHFPVPRRSSQVRHVQVDFQHAEHIVIPRSCLFSFSHNVLLKKQKHVIQPGKFQDWIYFLIFLVVIYVPQ